MPESLLTRTEELILLAVWNLQDEAYGARIQKKLSKTTNQDWSFGAVYIPLERMVGTGLLTSWKGESTPERGGRRKRHFRLTSQGIAALNTIRSIQNVLWNELDSVHVAGMGQ